MLESELTAREALTQQLTNEAGAQLVWVEHVEVNVELAFSHIHACAKAECKFFAI